jgi:hypothetical protein
MKIKEEIKRQGIFTATRDEVARALEVPNCRVVGYREAFKNAVEETDLTPFYPPSKITHRRRLPAVPMRALLLLYGVEIAEKEGLHKVSRHTIGDVAGVSHQYVARLFTGENLAYAVASTALKIGVYRVAAQALSTGIELDCTRAQLAAIRGAL